MRIQQITTNLQFGKMKINDINAWDKSVLDAVTKSEEINKLTMALESRGQDLEITYLFNKINGVWRNVIEFASRDKVKALNIENFFTGAAEQIKSMKCQSLFKYFMSK